SRALRGNLLWIAPAALLLFVGARTFFTLWAGPEFGEYSTVPFYILVIGLSFNVMAYVPYTLLLALGRSNFVARIHLLEIVPYLICAAFLTFRYGAVGAASAYSLRLAVDAVLLFLAVRYVAPLSDRTPPITQPSYITAVLILTIPIPLIGLMRMSPVALVTATAFSMLVYIWLVWLRVLTPAEREWISASLTLKKGRVMGS